MKKVKVQGLMDYVGYPVGKDIYANRKVIVKAKEILTKSICDKLKEEPYCEFIYLDTPDSQGIQVSSLVSEEIKQEITQRIDDMLLSFSDIRGEAQEIKKIVNIIMEAVYKDPFVIFNIDSMWVAGDKSLASHSINTSILSTILAIKAGLPKRDVENIAIGAILHDIGKLKIDTRLNDTTYRYQNREDYIKMSDHPTEGFKMIDSPEFSTSVRKIVLMHHVWEDFEASFNKDIGVYQSYPRCFNAKEISPKVKDLGVSIVQTCECFEAMINKARHTGTVKDRLIAIEYIRNMEEVRFGRGAKLLVSNISPFTIGSEVILNDSNRAIVMEHNNCPDRPYIKLTTGEKVGFVVNLTSLEGRRFYIEKEV